MNDYKVGILLGSGEIRNYMVAAKSAEEAKLSIVRDLTYDGIANPVIESVRETTGGYFTYDD